MCGIHRTKFRSWIRRMAWIGSCTDFGGISTRAVVWVLLGMFWLSVVGYQLLVDFQRGTVRLKCRSHLSEYAAKPHLPITRFSRKITHALIGYRSISADRHSPASTVNVDCLTGDIRGIFAEEESDRSCYLFRSTAAFHDAGPDGCLL